MDYRKMFSWEGHTALVAGASRGIGLAIAKAMAAQGAHTVLAARSHDTLESEAARLRQAGWSAEALHLNMTDNESIDASADGCREVDILVNVAGTNVRRKLQDYTAEEYERIMQTNLHGIVRLTRLIGNRMVERGHGGKVIKITGLMSDIQVNCIAPGFILTDLNREMWQPERMVEWLSGVQANPRLGTPDDIAGLAAFLASPAANYITGQVIASDGGYTTTAKWPFHPPS